MWISALEIALVVIQTYATKLVHAGNSPTILVLIIDHLAQDIIFLFFFCRSTYVSCTNTCNCSENCTNRQYFQEQKKVKVIKTQHCGWGVEAVEFIKKDDYIIEYVGEVIDNALREMRFRDMKAQGITKFYVFQVASNFNIDAKLKGNESRLINHSCDPNCTVERWEVNGETRLGFFALRAIEPGEELTFDYGDR
ncbi:putative [histone H3]-lysine(4) N-trimethyltransferase chromatin remodeling SET family [Helianthus anomalus]